MLSNLHKKYFTTFRETFLGDFLDILFNMFQRVFFSQKDLKNDLYYNTCESLMRVQRIPKTFQCIEKAKLLRGYIPLQQY